MTGVGLVWPVNAIAVRGARPDSGQVTMPDLIGVLGEYDPLQFLLAIVVKDAHFYLGGMGRKDRKVRTSTIPNRTDRMRSAFFNPISPDFNHCG
jgi:hypothetical protein